MNILVDTHALIWYLQAAPQLSPNATQAISSITNVRYVSMATFWEMSIKSGLGKLHLTVPLHQFFINVLSSGFAVLDITIPHTIHLSTLPSLTNHKDPFDRLIASQCLVQGWPIVSSDSAYDQYGVQRIW